MTVTGPELLIMCGMTLTFFAGAWFLIVRPAEKRDRERKRG